MSTLVTYNPATGEPLAEYAAFDDTHVDAVLSRADEAQARCRSGSAPSCSAGSPRSSARRSTTSPC
jgi:acyl-CoA reductase-like NAD-dependent aldehyde dehydrogenase